MSIHGLNTSIRVSMKSRDRLKLIGHKGQTYDDVLNMLMDEYKKAKKS